MMRRLVLWAFLATFGLGSLALPVLAAPAAVPDGTTDACGDTHANGGWDDFTRFPSKAPTVNNSATLHDGLLFKQGNSSTGVPVPVNKLYNTFGTNSGNNINSSAALIAEYYFRTFTGWQNDVFANSNDNSIDNPSVGASWTRIRTRDPGSGEPCDTTPLRTDHIDILTHAAPSGYMANGWIAGGMLRAQPNIVPGTVISYTAQMPTGEHAWLAFWFFGGHQYTPGVGGDPYANANFQAEGCDQFRKNTLQNSTNLYWPECYYSELDDADGYRATNEINNFNSAYAATTTNQMNGIGWVDNVNSNDFFTSNGLTPPSQRYNANTGGTGGFKVVAESSNLAVAYNSPDVGSGYHNFVINMRKTAPIVDFFIDGKMVRSFNYTMLTYTANTPDGPNTEIGMHMMITQEAVPIEHADIAGSNGPVTGLQPNDGLGDYGWGGKIKELQIWSGELACPDYLRIDNATSGTCTDATQNTGSEVLGWNAIGSVTANTPYTVGGTISGLTVAPTLQYSDNGGTTWNSIASSGVTTSTFSFTHPAQAVSNGLSMVVRDQNHPATTATSAAYNVVAAGGTPATITKAVELAYLNGIAGKGVIAGQYIERGGDPVTGFANIQNTHDNLTNPHQWLGMIGTDFWWYNSPSLTADCGTTVPIMQSYWNNGGILTLTTHMANPVSGQGVIDQTMTSTNANNLIIPGTTENTNLNTEVDSIAACLKTLSDGGAIVAYRPLHEGNIQSFWWGSNLLTPSQYIALYRYIHDRITGSGTGQHGLSNVLFIYVSNGGTASARYAGDSYVDIVGIDAYSLNPNDYISDYNDAVALGKTTWMSEFGFSLSPTDRNSDEHVLITDLKTNFPKIMAFQQWGAGNGSNIGWGMSDVSNVNAALNDAYVINRGSISMFTANSGGTPAIPGGALSVSGNQIVTSTGVNVRLAAVNYNHPSGTTSATYEADMTAIATAGFNAVRVPYYDATLSLSTLDSIVGAAADHGLRTIIYHAGNEANSTCLNGQGNGLWYDKNDTSGTYNVTNGTDGCTTPITGTITYATFKANWVAIATHFNANTNVIGFDLHNEPTTFGTGVTTQVNWAGTAAAGTPTPTNTRNRYLLPGGAGSAWVTPIGDGATWGAATDADTIDIHRGWDFTSSTCCYTNGPVGIINGPSNFGLNAYHGTSTDGQYTFTTTNDGNFKGDGTTHSYTLHVPTGSSVAGPSNGDNPILLTDPISQPNQQFTMGQMPSFTNVQPNTGPYTAGQIEHDDVTSNNFGEDQETSLQGYNVGAGTFTACDVSSSCNPVYPKVQHAWRYATDAHLLKTNATTPSDGCTLAPSSWPQRCQDGQTGINVYSGNLVAGTTLGIPSNTAMPTGLSTNCQGMFWTMQHYPGFFRDQAGGGLHLSLDQTAYASSWGSDVASNSCLPVLVGLLRPMRNQHQGGQDFTAHPKNGPGNRLDTGPPGLCTADANGGCMSGTGGTGTQHTRVSAPLTGTITAGTWSTNLSFTASAMPSGYMRYNVLLPAGYDATANVYYPVLFYGHANDEGMNGSTYPADGANLVAQDSINGAFNTVAFRTANPVIMVVPEADQSADLSGENTNANFGGYNDSANSGYNEKTINGLAAFIIANYKADPTRMYCEGDSLGAIGCLAWMADNNLVNGVNKIWTAGIAMSDQLYRPAASPNTASSIFTRMSTVPLLAISTPDDNSPTSYDQPAWTAYTSNSTFPTKTNYDSNGMAGIKASTSNFYYIKTTGGAPSDTFRKLNADGGDGTALHTWLFQQVNGTLP